MTTYGIDVPEGWTVEKSSYRLDNEGKVVMLSHEENQLEVWIEGILNEDVPVDYEGDTLGFWGVLREQTGPNEWTELEGPVHFTPGGYGTTEESKEAALEWLEEMVVEFA